MSGSPPQDSLPKHAGHRRRSAGDALPGSMDCFSVDAKAGVGMIKESSI